MTTDQSSLLDLVSATLSAAAVPHALVGATALATHGISRSTLDIDLLVTDRRVLDEAFWAPLPGHVRVDIRRGDAADPLAGVVRLSAEGERDVDIVVGLGEWESAVIARAAPPTPGQAGAPGSLAPL